MIYKTEHKINDVLVSNKHIYVFSNKKLLKIECISGILEILDIIGDAQGGFQYKDESLVYFTKNIVYLIEDKKIRKICEKEPLDYVLLYNNTLVNISEDMITVINLINFKVHDKELDTKRGICVGSSVKNDLIYLVFEDSSVCSCTINDLTDISDKVELNELFRMDENITAFDICERKVVISYFHKKVALCDIKGNDFMYTEVKYTVKRVGFWKGHIICLDVENNLFLFDMSLKLVYCENFEGGLEDFKIFENILYMILTDGTLDVRDSIVEYI